MTVLLIRHAPAGSPRDWVGDGSLRPLSAEGHRVAARLGDALGWSGVQRIVSSPYLRCRQSVAPWATAAGITVEPSSALAEGHGVEALALVRAALNERVALCTHGDVIADVLMALVNQDHIDLGAPRRRATTAGSTWVLEATDGRFTKATHLPPPDGSHRPTRPPPPPTNR